MNILKGILSESSEYYKEVEKRIKGKLSELPKGSVKKRKIGEKIYYYLQDRIGNKIIHKYLGKVKPEKLIEQIIERKKLKKELKKVIENKKTIKRAKVNKK